MQFIYIDETGLAEEPVGVMVGVIADSHRMRPTKEHWANLLITLSQIIGRQIKEIHTRDFYSGNSPWRNLSGHQRSAIITAIFEWLRERKHSIVLSSVDKAEFYNTFRTEEYSEDISTLWRFMALHLALSIQKHFQGSPRGRDRTLNPKGSCVLIFDNEFREEKHFTDLLLNAPDWSDSYYDKKPRQDKFSQIVDVPHFVDPKDVGLIQLADFICYFLRKYIELEMGYIEPEYDDEREKVSHWAKLILRQGIPKNSIYLSRGRCECANLFCKYAPEVIKLQKWH
jgi:hypothetical protein